jgi:hypothetical protein
MAYINIFCKNFKAGKPVYLRKYQFKDILPCSLTEQTEIF